MAKFFIALPALTAAGACNSDEATALSNGDVNGKAAFSCGTKAYNPITGFNKDTFNSCYTAAMGISASCSDCYATAGEYSAKNCKASCLLGWCKQGCLDCAQSAQDDAVTCTGVSPSAPTPCLVESAAGACNSDEATALSDGDVNGKAAFTCGTKAYNPITGFNKDTFNSCYTAAMGISTSCSDCYATAGEYSAKNCKASCLLGWCKQGCLDCAQSAQDDAITCTGVSPSAPTPCLVESAAGACSSEEATALSDGDVNGKAAFTCGTKAYNPLTGFNKDTFNSCYTAAMGISTLCSDCYATAGEYSAKNCKASCLLGWCKQGCLDCAQSAQDDAITCTGVSPSAPTPCLVEPTLI